MGHKALILVKPIAFSRLCESSKFLDHLVDGKYLSLIKIEHLPKEFLEELYREHKDEYYYEGLIKHFTEADESKVVYGAIHKVASFHEFTALKREVREMYKNAFNIKGTLDNFVHCSDSIESGLRETKMFYDLCEKLDYVED